MAAIKYSRQREAIKEFLMTRSDHPTADVIYQNIKLIYPNISLGTVYRNLGLLSDMGEILKITAGDGKEHYDGDVRPHNHFVCKNCGCVIDMHMDNIDHIMDTARQGFNGQIDGYTTIFYGTCGSCIKCS